METLQSQPLPTTMDFDFESTTKFNALLKEADVLKIFKILQERYAGKKKMLDRVTFCKVAVELIESGEIELDPEYVFPVKHTVVRVSNLELDKPDEPQNKVSQQESLEQQELPKPKMRTVRVYGTVPITVNTHVDIPINENASFDELLKMAKEQFQGLQMVEEKDMRNTRYAKKRIGLVGKDDFLSANKDIRWNQFEVLPEKEQKAEK